MRFPQPLESGRLLRRYKRFLADVEFSSGRVETVHCPNPGSMKTCLESGARVWVSRSDNPRRKLPCTLELIEVQEQLVYVNPVAVNRIVEEAIAANVVVPLRGYESIRRETPYGEVSQLARQRSRADFCLEGGGKVPCIVEVKSATLQVAPGRLAFPDSVSVRGAKHLLALRDVKRSGRRAVLLYCASRQGARSVEAARDIDGQYAAALDAARAEGVEVLAYGCCLSPSGVHMSHPIEVV